MKASLQKLLPANSFARGVAILSGGTTGAQLLLLLAAPILTRLYSPEDFGVLAVFVSILSILGIVASWRYELAIPIADDNEAALNVVALCLLITSGMTFLTVILVWLAGDWFAVKLNVDEVSAYFWLLPIGVFLIGIYQAFNYWATREKAFGRISKTKLTQSVGQLIVQLSCFKLGPLGLISGYIIGQVAGVTRLAKLAFNHANKKSVSLINIRASAKRYRRFPLLTTWAGLLNSAGQQIPFLFFAYLFGPAVVGIYAIANKFITSPLSVISQSVSTVFFAHSSDAAKKGELADIFISIHKKLLNVVAPFSALIIFFGPELFSYVFGEKWQQSGSVGSWLAVMIVFSFSTAPLSIIFTTLEKQGYALVMQINLVLMRVLGIVIGSFYNDFLITVIYFSIFSSLGYISYLFATAHACGAPVKKIIANYLKSLFPTLMFFLLLKNLYDLELIRVDITFIFIAVFSAIYYFYMIKKLKND